MLLSSHSVQNKKPRETHSERLENGVPLNSYGMTRTKMREKKNRRGHTPKQPLLHSLVHGSKVVLSCRNMSSDTRYVEAL